MSGVVSRRGCESHNCAAPETGPISAPWISWSRILGYRQAGPMARPTEGLGAWVSFGGIELRTVRNDFCRPVHPRHGA